MSDQQPQDTPAPTGAARERQPGAELRRAREATGQSIEEVARTLRLSADLIDAIERDDYDALPEATYVRGYLRSYSRLVGANADDIVAAFDYGIGGTTEPELAPRAATEEPLGDRSPRLAVAVLIAVVLAGVAAWWFVADPAPVPDIAEIPEGDAQAVPPDEETAAREEPVATETAPVEPEEAAPDSVGDRDDLSRERLSIEPVEVREPVDAAAEVPAPTESVEEGAMDTTEAEEAATVSEDEVVVPDVAAADTEMESEPVPETGLAAEAVQAAASTGPDRLTVTVDGESWVEIHDERGRQLVYTLYSGEEPLELRGWAPFDVFLGNSPDVTLAFEGEAVTKEGFTRADNTARFLVDADGARPRQ